MLRPVIQDLLCGHRPDAGKLVQLLERRGIQMDRPGRSRRRGAGAGRRSGDASRNDDLRPIGERRREVDRLQVGRARGAAGSCNGVGDAIPLVEAIETWPVDCSDDVDDEPLRRKDTLGNRHAGSRWIAGGSPGAREVAPRDQKHSSRKERNDDQLAARERETSHRCP